MATTAPSNQQGPGGTNIAVSAVFQPTANLSSNAPDVALVSYNRVFFYVHYNALITASNNGFASLLSNVDLSTVSTQQPVLVPVVEQSPVLNVILHTIYNMSAAAFNPSIPTLEAAVHGLAKYGTDVKTYIAWNRPLCNLLFARAPTAALAVYTIAAQYGLEDLAVATSPFLLSVKVTDVPIEHAERMGAIYLKRLLALQGDRLERLRAILREPPPRHFDTPDCDADQQDDIARAWGLTAAYLIWEQRPEITHVTISVTFSSLFPGIRCQQCLDNLQAWVARAANAWARERRHI
ncbi:hypothetical protein PHLGIDRAFT_122159 [Phlebiopsis gigantea 11061_1 CR5-6]|uniref:BTB domain-containing protein n=1 Tax=Phlebiopsis gigantea (strain 11061_1 CR5-6) TaxID=745531 RepID=A0A0C3RRP0_PHLG1|nr:hypothetical protein PHLGIDRAFT_122159 [Phlebiopsis gigantea 11061_1 CR5-6]